jgi:4-amino-4-deoxy-L-arabinose transferase-like glycosyltransferase
MTKGVAGGLGLAGVLVLFFIRNRFSVLVADYRAWLLTLLALVMCASYYGLRDQYDPGYLESAWQNEVSGRFFAVNEGHVAGPEFYIYFLLYNFEPGVILLPLTAISILGDNRRRRSVVILCLISTLGILVILTSSQTKLFWYTTPVLPFLAIASAIGLVDALNLINVRAGHLPLRGLLQIALGLVLALISALSLYRNQVIEPSVAAEQGWYGALFQELKAYGNIEDILVLDNGFEGTSKNYNPVLKFYADIARADGLRIKRVTEWTSAALPEDKIISTCDPDAIPFLDNLPKFLRKGSVHSCIFGRIDRESRR